MITCSECGTENADENAHCGQCGNPIQQSAAKKTMLAFALSPEKLQEAAEAAKAARKTREENAPTMNSADASASKLKLPKPEAPSQKEPLDPFAQTMMMGPDDASKLAANQQPPSGGSTDLGEGFASRDTPNQVEAVNVDASAPNDTRPPEPNKYITEPSGRAATMSYLDDITVSKSESKNRALIMKALVIFGLLAIFAMFAMFLLSDV